MCENTLSTARKQVGRHGAAPSSVYGFLLDGFTWSFSRVNSYATCPRMFKLQYIDCVSTQHNAFAEWGLLCHSVLEQYYRGQATLFELPDRYAEAYPKVMQHAFPFNPHKDLNAVYYQAGLDYFYAFDGFPGDAEVLGVELKFQITLAGYPFKGFIDLVVRDQKSGHILLIDHKSKEGFKSKAEQQAYFRQLYLYASYIYETYQEYPKQLIFNLFRSGRTVRDDFDVQAHQDALVWLSSTLQRIYADKHFKDKIALHYQDKGKKLLDFQQNDFFCNHLCAVRAHCNRSFQRGDEADH